MRTIPDWQKTSIPGRIHGDGVPYGEASTANVMVNNISSILGTGDTIHVLNLWFWMPKNLMCNASEHGVDTSKFFFNCWRLGYD